MYKLTLTCKVITPMFMSGSDGRSPELRPSEIKGLMRFWWRAIKAEKDITKLKNEEFEIFGGIGERANKSKIKIRVKPDPKNTYRGKYKRLPHNPNKTFKLDCFNINTIFKIIIESHKDISFFRDLLIISIILGGFGKGARRGFGSIEICEPAYLKFENIEVKEFLEKITYLLNNIDNHFIVQNSKIINTRAGTNYPWIKEIEVGKNHVDWEELLKKIGEASHKYRDPSLGCASPRMASPIYVSVIKLKNMYYPIVTTLQNSFPTSHKFSINLKKQEDFKREVLS